MMPSFLKSSNGPQQVHARDEHLTTVAVVYADSASEIRRGRAKNLKPLFLVHPQNARRRLCISTSMTVMAPERVCCGDRIAAITSSSGYGESEETFFRVTREVAVRSLAGRKDRQVLQFRLC